MNRLTGRDPASLVLEIWVAGAFVFFIFKIVQKCIRRISPNRLQTTTERLIELFPYLEHSVLDGITFSDTTCQICQSEFEQTEHVRVLPCHHVFHHKCVTAWMARELICPICRRDYSRIVAQ